MKRALWTIVCATAFAACASGENKPGGGGGTTGTGGSGGSPAAGGTTGTGGSGGSPETGGTGTGGTTSAGGTGGTPASGGTTGTGGGGGTPASGGTTGTGGSGGTPASGGTTGTGGAAGGSTGTATAGCANHAYPLCLDFESGVDTAVWSGGNTNAIETTHVAHGTHAYHLYSMATPGSAGGVFTTSKLGTLKDQIWGRFYVHFSPGAPGGHGNLLAASDGVWANGNYNGNWYEIGWQFDGIMGVFHTGGGGERPLRSMPYLADQWTCIELFFDGTVKGDPKWWIDGTEAKYYTPMAGVCCSATNPTTPASVLIPQFKSITVGWTPYAGLGLMLPDQNKIVDGRVLKDAWIDDIAFDTKRIGCIQ